MCLHPPAGARSCASLPSLVPPFAGAHRLRGPYFRCFQAGGSRDCVVFEGAGESLSDHVRRRQPRRPLRVPLHRRPIRCRPDLQRGLPLATLVELLDPLAPSCRSLCCWFYCCPTCSCRCSRLLRLCDVSGNASARRCKAGRTPLHLAAHCVSMCGVSGVVPLPLDLEPTRSAASPLGSAAQRGPPCRIHCADCSLSALVHLGYIDTLPRLAEAEAAAGGAWLRRAVFVSRQPCSQRRRAVSVGRAADQKSVGVGGGARGDRRPVLMVEVCGRSVGRPSTPQI